jgi:IS30 family transposase
MDGKAEEAGNLAAYAVAGPPEHALPAIRRLRRLLDECEPVQVAAARAAGWNWGEIARTLGRSRQAVHRRYRNLPRGEARRPLTQYEVSLEIQRLYTRKLKGEIDSATFLREQRALWEQLPSV